MGHCLTLIAEMDHRRRQSTTGSEEFFEFVDFTSVSNFERLSTALEEILNSWGTRDGDYGIFGDNIPETPETPDGQQQQQCKQIQEYARSEYVCIGDKTYKITYHCHPYAFQRQHQQQRHPAIGQSNTHISPLAYPDFSFLSQQTIISPAENSTETHSLHRWTGFDRLFVLTLAQGSLKSKIFSQGRNSVELPQAKKLLSACTIAIQNVKCPVPVFVPAGQSRHGMYIGYLLGPAENDSGGSSSSSSSNSDLHDVEFRFNTSLTFPITPKDARIDGLFVRFSQKMDMFYEDCGVFPLKDTDKDCKAAAAFTYTFKNFFDENWKILDGWNEQLTARPPSLPFGSYNDPLRALTLKTIFPLASLPVYMDNATQTNMNLLTSHHWYLSREIAPNTQQRSFLSSLLDNLISSWVRDPENHSYLSPYDSSNENGNGGSNSRHLDGRDRTDPGLVRNLFQAVGSNRGRTSAQPSETSSPVDQINLVLRALFVQEPDCTLDTYVNEGEKLLSANGLGFRLKHGASVPYRSFFWNFLFYALHAMSDPSKMQANSYFTFLKTLWTQAVRQIRWHWENTTLIPNVDTALYQRHNSAQEYPDVCGIDLRYSIIHQKIAMINCCIKRCIRDGMQKPKSDGQRRPVSTLLDDLVGVQKPNRAPDGALNKFNSFLERLVDGDEELQKENNDASTQADNIDIDEDEGSELSEGDMFFDPLEDFDELTKKPTQFSPESQKSTSTDKTAKSPSRSSSLSDVSELAHPHSMSESFVRLNYPSSAESYNSRRHRIVPDNSPQGYEVEDPDGSEGCKYRHPSLKLLKTNEPMCIPETQDGGFMTEDMIEQQASVLENLGTSESATRLRAKLQSAQLFSDMQAFKAANPHAMLEDFVRWHSPRDWIEKDGEGHLSARMSDPKNIWQELWKKPLFDALSEGEKALNYLETLSIQEIFAMLLPTVFLIAYDTLVSHPAAQRVKVNIQGIRDLGKDIIDFRWDQLIVGKTPIAPLIFTIRKQEAFMCNTISLLRKLPDQEDLVNRLLANAETEVLDGPERDSVLDLFVAERMFF
ncbi:Rab3 GTPase-activating protein catalytic subunit-domain-containing protein [Dichotomocladium elegans]|nr:Rab3 GTPase-activating protein catalytic subunit-domain-containing protein [Dichotomocladium elegans]